jgi:cytochrome bd-type quinol oxidase subunit 2
MWKFLVALATVGAVVLVLARLRSTADRARFLQRAGLVLTAIFTVVGAAWLAAEAFTDPGGWKAAGLVAMWLLPLAVLLAILVSRRVGDRPARRPHRERGRPQHLVRRRSRSVADVRE